MVAVCEVVGVSQTGVDIMILLLRLAAGDACDWLQAGTASLFTIRKILYQFVNIK